MKEGKDFIAFIKPRNTTKTKITEKKADENYSYWIDRFEIINNPVKKYPNTFKLVNNLFGNHTFPFRLVHGKDKIYPIKNIFGLNTNRSDSGLQSNRKRGGGTRYMNTPIELGLDNLVYSYLGVHDPHHRQYDCPPVMPFGLFLDPGQFAFTHGNLRDRDYHKNEHVKENELEYYFLKQEDLRKLITWRIETDTLFAGDFWKYFGKENFWNDIDFVDNHWKNKAELCFYEQVPIKYIKAVLWPVWEEGAINDEFTPDELQNIDAEVKSIYKRKVDKNLHITYYRPYGDIINSKNWHDSNQRDWEFNLIKASSFIQDYYNMYNTFPHEIIKN